MADIQHIFSGNGAPLTVPSGVGHHYIDNTNKVYYSSVNTLAPADWKKMGAVYESSNAPLAPPTSVGDIHIDVLSSKSYIAVGLATVNNWVELGAATGGSGGSAVILPAESVYIQVINGGTSTLDLTNGVRSARVEIIDTIGATLKIVLPTEDDPLDSVDGLASTAGLTIISFQIFASIAMATALTVEFYRADGVSQLVDTTIFNSGLLTDFSSEFSKAFSLQSMDQGGYSWGFYQLMSEGGGA